MNRLRPTPSRWVVLTLVLLLAIAGALFVLTRDAQEASKVDGAKADAAVSTVAAICESGDKAACRLLEQLDAADVAESQDDEIQEPEVQESEVQESEVQEGERDDVERQDPEPNDPEAQDPETQDPEVDQPEQQDPDANDPDIDDADSDDPEQQDPEVQDDEQQDPEVDDPEIQDNEVQDPELDDPDPNSLFDFIALDSCSPPAGEVVTDVDLTMLRDPDARTVTYVLSCKSAPIASMIDLPGQPTQP